MYWTKKIDAGYPEHPRFSSIEYLNVDTVRNSFVRRLLAYLCDVVEELGRVSPIVVLSLGENLTAVNPSIER